MKTATKNLAEVGTVINTYEARAANTILAARKLCQPLQDILDYRKRFTGKDPDQQALSDITSQSGRELLKEIHALIEEDCSDFKSPAALLVFQEKEETIVAPVRKKISELNILRNQLQGYGMLFADIQWEDFSIKDGEVVIDEERIRERYQVKIESQEESEIIGLFQQLKAFGLKIRQRLIEEGFDTSGFSIFSENGFIHEQYDCTWEIDFEAIKYFLSKQKG